MDLRKEDDNKSFDTYYIQNGKIEIFPNSKRKYVVGKTIIKKEDEISYTR